MPIRSQAQQRLMFAARANPAVAKRTGVPQSVAAEMIEKTPKKAFADLPAKRTDSQGLDRQRAQARILRGEK